MFVRHLPVVLALLALVVFSMPALAEEDKDSHAGTVVSTVGGKLTMTGADGKEHSHAVAADAKISCDGKECKLEDLKKGTKIKVFTKKGDKTIAVRIEGQTK